MPKILRQNVGGIDYAMAGCALSGSCATAASDFVKVVTLSDGDTVSDGMSLAVAFTNGNTAGNAPGTTTIYSSDQVHYFSDSGLTQPFTLAPAGCYTITYTGTGNAYTYKSFPVLSVGGVTAPVCSINGKNIGASAWNAGDTGVFIYTAGKFLLVSVNLDSTTGVLPIAHGGTGQTTQADINKAFVAALGSATADVTDGTEFISSNATDNGFSETGDGGPNKPYRRQFVKVWNYIKGKISSVLGLSTTGLSTGTITTTGDINVGKGKSIVAIGTKANYSMIKFKDNTGDANGNGVVIGGGGATVIGGGESADTYYSGASLSAGSEIMAVVNDGAINFVSNLQSGYANGKTMTMGTDGKLTNSQGFVGPLTGNASTATTASNLNGRVQKATKTFTTLDLSSLDASKWYPCTIPLDVEGWKEIECYVSLNSGTKPSWSSHNGGFSCHLHLFVMRSGWGTTAAQTLVLDRSYSFTTVNGVTVIPTGWTQMTNSSQGVLWLRGGGKYFVWNSNNDTFTIRTSTYTASDQSVAPTTTYQWSFNKANTFGYFTGDLSGSATSIRDSGNSTAITASYSKAGQESTNWLASWNGYEIGAISPSKLFYGNHTRVGDSTLGLYDVTEHIIGNSAIIAGRFIAFRMAGGSTKTYNFSKALSTTYSVMYTHQNNADYLSVSYTSSSVSIKNTSESILFMCDVSFILIGQPA